MKSLIIYSCLTSLILCYYEPKSQGVMDQKFLGAPEMSFDQIEQINQLVGKIKDTLKESEFDLFVNTQQRLNKCQQETNAIDQLLIDQQQRMSDIKNNLYFISSQQKKIEEDLTDTQRLLDNNQQMFDKSQIKYNDDMSKLDNTDEIMNLIEKSQQLIQIFQQGETINKQSNQFVELQEMIDKMQDMQVQLIKPILNELLEKQQNADQDLLQKTQTLLNTLKTNVIQTQNSEKSFKQLQTENWNKKKAYLTDEQNKLINKKDTLIKKYEKTSNNLKEIKKSYDEMEFLIQSTQDGLDQIQQICHQTKQYGS